MRAGPDGRHVCEISHGDITAATRITSIAAAAQEPTAIPGVAALTTQAVYVNSNRVSAKRCDLHRVREVNHATRGAVTAVTAVTPYCPTITAATTVPADTGDGDSSVIRRIGNELRYDRQRLVDGIL